MTTQTEAKRIPTIDATIEGANILRLAFSDGSVIRINAEELSPEIREAAMMHGLKQKLVDAAAISRNPETGRSATVSDKFKAVNEVAQRLLSGSWNKGRSDGEGSGNGGLLFRALCELYPNKTPEQLREFLAGKSKEEQAALRASPKIAAIIDRLRAKKSADTDVDALLGELDA